MTRFYPKGFIGSEEAILTIARTRDPERWKVDAMSSDERQVWDTLGSLLNATFIYDHLPCCVSQEDRAKATANRYCDFMDALGELRKSLFAGETVAWFRHADGRLDHILKDGWGGDAGEDILLKGTVSLEGGLWERLLLLKLDDIVSLARSLPSAWSDEGKPREITQSIRRAVSEKREIFAAWRESQLPRIPTISEDVAAMEDQGISRDDTRQLRKDHPSLPRGKPKAKIGGG